MDLKYYKELNGIRGIAALMVMFFHFMPGANAIIHPIIHYIHKAAVFGQTGVTLFFVLSGFLITRILLQAKHGNSYFLNFYIKRALRIFPLYYFALVLYYFVVPLFISNSGITYHNSWMYWVYLQNISDTFHFASSGPQHFWSLAVEEHFYLFWPVLVYYTSAKNLFRVIISILAGALICRLLLIHFGYGTFYFTFSIMDALAIGGLLAWYEINKPLYKIRFNLIIICSLLLMIPAWLLTGGKGYDWVQVIKFPLIAFFYMAIIGKLISSKSWLNNVFSSDVLGFTGKISYGLYVFHPFCFMIWYHYFPGNSIWFNFAACFLSSYLAAALSFYAFELHFLKLKKYVESDKWYKKTAPSH